MSGNLQSIFGAEFPTNSVPPQEDYDVLPPGKYPSLIETAEIKSTKAHTGHYIEIRMSVLDGPFKNRKIFDRINIDNPNAQCVEIGMRSLAALGLALGLQAIGDTAQLLNGIVVPHVKVKDGQNEVRTYSSMAKFQADSQAQAGAQQRPAFQPPQQQFSPSVPAPAFPQQPVQPPQQPQQAYAPPVQPQQPPQQPQASPGKPPWVK